MPSEKPIDICGPSRRRSAWAGKWSSAEPSSWTRTTTPGSWPYPRAAVDAAAALAGADDLQAEAYHCQFAARGKVGPFRATAEAFRGGAGRIGVRLTLNDEGNGDRAVTSASLLLRTAG